MLSKPISRPIVFVLGAGASKPYGFPLASELGGKIINGLSGEFFRSMQGSIVELERSVNRTHPTASKVFRDSKLPSIDEFLGHQRQYKEWGYLAIFAHLLDCERNNPRVVPQGPNPGGDWLGWLWSKIHAPPEIFKRHKITFISFNYDRVVEQYFCLATSNTFGSLSSDAHRIEVLHLHGSLSPFCDSGGSSITNKVLRYGGEGLQVTDMLANMNALPLKCYWETDKDDPVWTLAAQRLREAHRTYVLGIGSALEPVERLFRMTELGSQKRLHFTSLGLEDGETRQLANSFASLWAPTPDKCDSLTLLRRHLDINEVL